jgi:predicted RNA-binding Zn-ribbon protein involved in translation (DUF1610 family)
MINRILVGALLVVAGLTVFFFLRGDPQTRRPDTAESRTDWICVKCGKTVALTAKQFDEWSKSPDKPRRDPNANLKQSVFRCDNCNAYTIVRALYCKEHDKWYWPRDPDGKQSMCPECRKQLGK